MQQIKELSYHIYLKKHQGPLIMNPSQTYNYNLEHAVQRNSSGQVKWKLWDSITNHVILIACILVAAAHVVAVFKLKVYLYEQQNKT